MRAKVRIGYIHPETGTVFTTGWHGRSRIARVWRAIADLGIVAAWTELR